MDSCIRSCFILCVASSIGCSYYDASLLEPRGTASDAGLDADSDASKDVSTEVSPETGADAPSDNDVVESSPDVEQDVGEAQVCGHARPPDPPSGASGGGSIEFSVAVSQVEFGDGTGNPGAIGYDLDFLCTCQVEANGCLRESWATANACDGPEGRDNASGAFISKMAALFSGFGSEAWSEQGVEGSWSLILRVRGYNGLPDDDQVRLDWYITDQFWEDKPDDSYKPAWDGTDTWPIRSTGLEDLGGGTYDIESPKYYDDHAYVSGGILVGSLTESSLQVSADYSIDFKGAFVTANVVNGPMGWELENGLLAARWMLSNILSQVSRVELLGTPVCTNHLAYNSLKQQVCAFADIYSGVGSPTSPCDSISTGMAFETVPAGMGEIVVNVPIGNPCEPEFDPGKDTCENL